MKTVNILFLLLLPLLSTSCGSKEERLKKEYIEACAAGDFDKARGIVTKLEAVDDTAAVEGYKYINDKEIYSLLAKPSHDNDSRILYLYNSFESDKLPDMEDVVVVALSMGNDNLPEKLIKAGVAPTSFSMVKAAINADNRDLVEMIIKKYPESILDNEVLDYAEKELGMSSLREEIANVLKNSLIEINKEVPTFHSEGLVYFYDGKDYAEEAFNPEDKPKYKMPEENAAIARYNKKLMNIYAEALKIQRKDIALDALNAMKPTIEAYPGSGQGENIRGYKVDKGHYLIYHNYDEINKLKKELGR